MEEEPTTSGRIHHIEVENFKSYRGHQVTTRELLQAHGPRVFCSLSALVLHLACSLDSCAFFVMLLPGSLGMAHLSSREGTLLQLSFVACDRL